MARYLYYDKFPDLKSVLGICDILVHIADPDSNPDPTPFFSDFKDEKKNFIFIL